MRKKTTLFIIVIALMTIGYASKNATIRLNTNSKIMMDLEDFKFELKSVELNGKDISDSITDNKQSFSFLSNLGSNGVNLTYKVKNLSTEYDADVTLDCTPAHQGVKIEQEEKTIVAQTIEENTITFKKSGESQKICEYANGTEWTFDYTGEEQTFDVPCSGIYKIETWGASGNVSSSSTSIHSYGGYSTGKINSSEGETYYINVGGVGEACQKTVCSGGYNGGGSGKDWGDARGAGGGGGATHIALVSGLLSTLENNKNDILIVSGGGGGIGGYNYNKTDVLTAGSGGGFIGGTGISLNKSINFDFYAYGGTQSSGGTHNNAEYANAAQYMGTFGSFGEGGNCLSSIGNCSGGGGGYYGGASNSNFSGAGAGGSGYIGNIRLTNKEMYCNNCSESSDESTKTISTSCNNSTATENCAKEGNGYVKVTLVDATNDLIQYTCKLNVKGISRTEKAKTCEYESGYTWEFDYTGNEQSFEVPCNGTYKLETWGAQGGNISGVAYNSDGSVRSSNITYTGGNGAYVSAKGILNKSTMLYVYVGGHPTDNTTVETIGSDVGGYNGGAYLQTGHNIYGAPGGGATDIRLVNGNWYNEDSIKSRILVAAGGGGANFRNQGYGEGNGGAGGTLIGINGSEALTPGSYFRSDYPEGYGYGTGGTQSEGGHGIRYLINGTTENIYYTVGNLGGTNYRASTDNSSVQSGGGGGYYSGGSAAHGGAGGGSSYIKGFEGCDETYVAQQGNIKLINGVMIAGNDSMPSRSENSEVIGNTGNGYARITYIS